MISAYGRSPDKIHAAINAAFGEIRRVDGLMSLHRGDSELTRVNRLASRAEGILVSEDLFTVIRHAHGLSKRTSGAFDVTIRPLADLWGFIWKEYRMPTEAELAEVRPRMGWNAIHLDPEQQRIRFSRSGISLDLGGIAKGFAVDKAVEALVMHGVSSAMVRAGGDLRVVGLPPGKDHWELQLEDPMKKGNRVTIPLRQGALSTSGDYENFFEIDGQRYSHLLDPRTGKPIREAVACSVVADTCMETDAWATACMILGPDQSLARFGKELGIRITSRSQEEAEAPLKVRISPSFPKALP